jgi:hypothetical protein
MKKIRCNLPSVIPFTLKSCGDSIMERDHLQGNMLQYNKRTRMLFNQQYKFNSNSFSTTSLNLNKIPLNPWFVTGFADGESSFIIRIIPNSEYKLGWTIQPRFQIGLHKKDLALLQQIQTYFGVGHIYKQGTESVGYCIVSIKDLEVIIKHFDSYGLISQKCADYQLFKRDSINEA